MANTDKKTTKHISLVDRNIGSKKDGSPKRVLKRGVECSLTKAEVLSYKSLNFI